MQNNPIIEIPPTKTVKVLNTIVFLIIVGNLTYAGIVFQSLPEEIPIHFNISGETDNWGNKGTIFLLPLLFKVIFLLLYFLQRSPYMFNYPIKVTEVNAKHLYQLGRLALAVMNVEVALIMAFLTWGIIQTAQGNPVLSLWSTLILIILPLVTILIFIIRMLKYK
ncbi:Protein of unknown function [Salinibacillus kushneri]|uniref:DUF1648 domain-containing protein n=1 Tax=Salinibacillus kushneri TaxID=237682 RepID=A0A1I0IIW4_9BACI|nr:DUF1648 domain-containing protein [Salinibacillus kushneri]SET96157.1 Protein of unknown function [Salinibacillus kushneri]